ncbi:hypothetical protein FACS189450_13690 [Spirochaetia bacterium]|nr:hypothetical protein FACS189450_13690 [Spirochaetia bacterium]
MKIAKTPNAGKAAFLATILIGTPVASVFLGTLASCDTGNNPIPEKEKPGKEYEDVTITSEDGAWMNDYLTIKKEKGMVISSGILTKFENSFTRATGNPIVADYLWDPVDWSVRHKLPVFIEISGTEPSLSTDGIHLPLTYLANESLSAVSIANQLEALITSLSTVAMQAKQVGQQAKEIYFANNRAARQQSALNCNI